MQSPSSPTLGTATPNLPGSKGYEGLAITPNGRVLHPMLEGATAEDVAAGIDRALRIYTVRRVPSRTTSSATGWRAPPTPSATS